MPHHGMLLDGHRVTTDTEADVIDPAVGAPFATVPEATAAHVDEAVTAAERAFREWRAAEALRRDALEACAKALKANADVIAPVLSREQGKPLRHARGEVLGAARWFSHFASVSIESERLQDDASKRIEILRKPLGVVAAITPWNFPVTLLAWKLAPALRAGNTVVAKPSPFTPLSSLMVADALREILPPGVLNVLTGGNELGATLAAHPGVRKVSFTGSVATGKKVMRAAADDLKRITLELGGNDPAIVLDDADLDALAEPLFWAAFHNSGQVCTAVKRLYVPSSLHDRLVAKLVERARRTKVGSGLEPDVELGPINNLPQLERVLGLLDDAREAGGRIEVGGERLERPGYFVPPTVVTEVGRGTRLVDEEQFGPVLPVVRYERLDDALEQANATHFGLGASVWTSNLERGEAVARELEAGTSWVNHHLDLGPAQPFGGHKWSGLGLENGRWGLEELTQLQLISVKKN
jgi:acyl-CoA reductase-like NAD-dependent aldehyde dehydrogenase